MFGLSVSTGILEVMLLFVGIVLAILVGLLALAVCVAVATATELRHQGRELLRQEAAA